MRATKRKPEGVVHIKHIEAVATTEDVKLAVLRELGTENESKRVELASLRQAYAGTQNAIIHVSKQDETRLLEKGAIKIGLPLCRMVANKQVETCFRCWLPGYTAKTCKGPDRSKSCRNCGKDGHKRQD